MQLARNPSPKRAGQTVLRPLGVGHLYLPSLSLALLPFVMRSPFTPPTSPSPFPLSPFPLLPLAYRSVLPPFSARPERNVRRRTVDSDREVTTSDSLQQVSQAGLQQDSQ